VNSYLSPNLTQYQLLAGDLTDSHPLLEFLQITYQELYPAQQDYQHLQLTVDRYFSTQTPLWFVTTSDSTKIACLWLGIAIDQVTGIRHPNIFLIYVDPIYRRQGIGHTLMGHAEAWAKSQGYTQIGLQVFTTNQPAIELYHQLGYESRSISMIKEF
jgi:ribosomal protein S18 acetylase RimI-like enzyme